MTVNEKTVYKMILYLTTNGIIIYANTCGITVVQMLALEMPIGEKTVDQMYIRSNGCR